MADVKRMGAYLCHQALKKEGRARRAAVSEIVNALSIQERTPTLIAAILWLAETVDGCGEVSAIAQEYVRGRATPAPDPYHAAVRGDR